MPSKTSGSSCATTASRTASSKAATTSSPTAAPHGMISLTSHGASVPSASARGNKGSDQCGLDYFRRSDPAMSEEAFPARCSAALEQLIQREGADTIAAFIGEPVLGTGGIVPPPA